MTHEEQRKKIEALQAGAKTSAPAIAPKAVCVHLDTVPVERTDASGVACLCPGKWLYDCDLFGHVRPSRCRACPAFEA